MQAADRYLDDERFVAPWRARFPARLGRPSVPIDTLLQLLSLKHRYQLGYESLCREVSDPIGWRRFCRIGLDRPPPHPTTLVKLGEPGRPEVIEELNAHPTDADLLGTRSGSWVGWSGAARAVAWAQPDSAPGTGPSGRASHEAAGPHAAPTHWGGDAEVDRLTGEVVQLARQSLREVQACPAGG